MNLYREMCFSIKEFSKTFWVIIAATFMNQVGNMAFVFLVVYSTQYLGFSLSQSVVEFGAFAGSTLLTGILAGYLIDNLGAARIMIFSIVMNSITLIIIPTLHHYYLIVVMCIFWGGFIGLFRPVSQTLVSYFSAEGRHKITFSILRFKFFWCKLIICFFSYPH